VLGYDPQDDSAAFADARVDDGNGDESDDGNADGNATENPPQN